MPTLAKNLCLATMILALTGCGIQHLFDTRVPPYDPCKAQVEEDCPKEWDFAMPSDATHDLREDDSADVPGDMIAELDDSLDIVDLDDMTSDISEMPSQPVCPNGKVEEGEDCESPWDPSAFACRRLELGYGQVGCNESTCSFDVSNCRVPIALSASVHTCTLVADGSLWCWGANGEGQLGDGTKEERTRPVQIMGLDKGSQVAAGDEHTCVLVENGTVWCMGSGEQGQPGRGEFTSEVSPAQVKNLIGATQIAAGGAFTCARLDTGRAKCWGLNYFGALGSTSTRDNETLPVDVQNLTTIERLAAGTFHACALLSSQSLQCWGANFSGQLGDGDSGTTRSEPRLVSGLANVVEFDVGFTHTCAVTQDRKVWCWGNNEGGQLGDGTTENRPTPTMVRGIENVVKVATGNTHTCALISDGRAWCWGENSKGQLGDGSNVASTTPLLVALEGIEEITVGTEHTCARLKDSTIRCWGSGANGRLGNGERVDQLAPTEPRGL